MLALVGDLRGISIVSILFRIFLAILIGGIIGIERERKHRPAGLRTYILVCLGAMLVMVTNQFVYETYHVSDPVRLGAQVISGIGFLGAGTIVITGKNQIKGLTTAAGLWTAACSGLAIGIGFYEGALLGGLAIIFTVSGLQKIDNWLRKNSRYIEVYIEFNSGKNQFGDFIKHIKDNHLEIVNMQISNPNHMQAEGKKREYTCYTLFIRSDIKRNHTEMLDLLSREKGIISIEEL